MGNERFASLSNRLLATYGGTVVLSRLMPGPEPENPWDPPLPPVTVAETIPFIHTKAAVEFLAGGMVLAGDLVGILQVPAGALGEPKLADSITHDGDTYTLLDVQPVSADGDAIHYAVQGRK